MKIKLTQYQKTAIKNFEEFGYLVVEAPRRSGKTTLLKEIIKRHPDCRIGVCCLFYNSYRRDYKEFEYIPQEELKEAIKSYEYDIIIGDEILIKPDKRTRTACVLTKRYFTNRWETKEVPFFSKDLLIKMKRQLSVENYRVEFLSRN